VEWLPDQPGFLFRHPGAIFAPNLTYTIDVGSGVVDVNGTQNSLDHRWDIATAPAPIVVTAEPADGTLVARDAPLTINFSRPMNEASLQGAVRLEPSVPGTRVVRNSRDHGRFLVLPGRLLEPGTAYALSINTSATDEHRARLGTETTVHFNTGPIRPTDHALTLVNQSGEGATTVVLSRLAPLQFGEPIPSETLLAAPRCTAAACGAVAAGHPLVTYRDAQLAPGSRWLALVEADETVPSAPTHLRIVDLNRDVDRTVVPGGRYPAWSPDGAHVAFADAAGGATLYAPATDTFAHLPTGGALVGHPAWLSGGESVALPAQGATTTGIDLAVPSLGARYPLPQLRGRLDTPIAGPGNELALRSVEDGGVVSTWVAGSAGAAAVQLPGAVSPVGFLDAGRLLCSDETGRSLVIVTVATREVTPLSQTAASGQLPSLVMTPSGRQIAYVSSRLDGVAEAVVANSDGSGPLALTRLDAGQAAVAVSVQ